MKKVCKHLIAFGIILVISILADVLIFNGRALTDGYENVVYSVDSMDAETVDSLAQLSEEEQRALQVELENQRIFAEYNGEEFIPVIDESLVEQDGVYYQKVKETHIRMKLGATYYIKKLKLSLPLEESAGYTVSLYEDGILYNDIYCSINPKLDAGVANVDRSTDSLEIVILTVDDPGLSDIRVEISNKMDLNSVRIAFFVIMLFLFYMILFAGKEIWTWIKAKPQWFFAISAFLMGSLLIYGIGTNQVSFDEHVHAKSAYKLSFGSTIETTEAAMQMVGNQLPYFNNPEERRLVEDYENMVHDPEYIAPDIGHQSVFPRAETRVYYPMALGFYLGRALDVDFADMVALAKFGNLLCYIAIVFWAVKKAKGYGMVVAAIGLLPNNLFIASALSYDALVTSCLLFAYVLLLNEILTPDEKMKPVNAMLMLVAFVVGCLSKPIYILMVWMTLFFSHKKFHNKWAAAVFKIAVIVLAGLMIYNIFFPTPVAGGDYQLVSNVAYSGDKRNVGTSTTGQLAFILGNPLTYTKILLQGMFGKLFSYLDIFTSIGKVPYVGYAYLGTAPFFVNWILIVLGVFASVFADVKNAIGKWFGGLSHLMNFGVAAVVFTSMYVSYTAVGSESILGVQGRYFIPLFLPFLSCLFAWGLGEKAYSWTKKLAGWREKIHALPAVYERVIYGVLFVINLWMTWTLVIMRMNV
ncbi:MAG: DUF2142 domain-containing protein [Lachnospiraceae bacterium]|nr:DUF2142 domain-containing protein [Lachnospiraceae bacterium]